DLGPHLRPGARGLRRSRGRPRTNDQGRKASAIAPILVLRPCALVNELAGNEGRTTNAIARILVFRPWSLVNCFARSEASTIITTRVRRSGGRSPPGSIHGGGARGGFAALVPPPNRVFRGPEAPEPPFGSKVSL